MRNTSLPGKTTLAHHRDRSGSNRSDIAAAAFLAFRLTNLCALFRLRLDSQIRANSYGFRWVYQAFASHNLFPGSVRESFFPFPESPPGGCAFEKEDDR